MSPLIPVEFDGDRHWLGQRDGDPLVAMRPVCEALGLDWSGQRQRMLRHPVMAEGVVMITTPSAGGMQQTMMLPLRLLPGWLFGIDSRRVRPELRDKIVRYQEHCFTVLHEAMFGRRWGLSDIEAFLPQRELRVLAAMRSLAAPTGQVRATVAQIARTAGVSYETAYRAMGLLTTVGLMEPRPQQWFWLRLVAAPPADAWPNGNCRT